MATLAVTGSLAESGGGKAVLLQVDQKDHVYGGETWGGSWLLDHWHYHNGRLDDCRFYSDSRI